MMPLREEKLLLTLSFMLCSAVGIAIFLLVGFHVYLTCSSQTTIEFHGNWSAKKRALAAGRKWKNPYSHGSCKTNWQQVYGTGNLLLAMLPSRREPELLPVPIPGRSSLRIKAPADEKVGGCDENVISCDASTDEGLKVANCV